MRNALNTKKVLLIAPQSVATTATQTASVDCAGYDMATIDVLLGTGSATTFPIALTIQHQDVATGTYTTIVGTSQITLVATGGTTAATTSYLTSHINVAKRYLKINITPGVTTVLSAVATLSRAKVSPAQTSTGVNSKIYYVV